MIESENWARRAVQFSGNGVNRALRPGVHRTVWRRQAADHRADVDDAGAFTEVFHGSLRGEQETEDVHVEDLVVVLFGEGIDGEELLDAGVVDEDVEVAEVLDGCVDEALSLSGLRDIATDGDGFATGGCDGGDHIVRTSLAGGVVDDDGGALRGERFGDGGSDTLGCAGDDCDFTCELAHIYIPLSLPSRITA